MALASDVPITAADSARVAGEVYGTSLLVSLPILVALAAGLLLRGATAGTRIVVWRCTVVLVVAIIAGRLSPVQWVAWILPQPLASPLATLGMVQVAPAPRDGSALAAILPFAVTLYWAGVAIVLLPTAAGRWRLARARRRAVRLGTPRWQTILAEASRQADVRPERIRLLMSPDASVPVTWGLWRPVVMLPASAQAWPHGRRRAVLVHELAHVRGGDATTLLALRVACALFWFHPGVWWLAGRFSADAEEACDDRVLLSGVRRSQYAEWLAASASSGDEMPAMALARRGGLRRRLRTVTDTRRHVAPPARAMVLLAVAVTAIVALPLSTVRFAPTRVALTALMQDQRWESRAWAVVRLAQRPDSVDVARQAASHDPDPSVRAWARYALARGAVAPPPRPRS